MTAQILTDNEGEKLLLNFARARHSKGKDWFSEAEAEAIIKWAEEIRISSTLLDLAIKHQMFIDVDKKGEVGFFPVKGGRKNK